MRCLKKVWKNALKIIRGNFRRTSRCHADRWCDFRRTWARKMHIARTRFMIGFVAGFLHRSAPVCAVEYLGVLDMERGRSRCCNVRDSLQVSPNSCRWRSCFCCIFWNQSYYTQSFNFSRSLVVFTSTAFLDYAFKLQRNGLWACTTCMVLNIIQITSIQMQTILFLHKETSYTLHLTRITLAHHKCSKYNCKPSNKVRQVNVTEVLNSCKN